MCSDFGEGHRLLGHLRKIEETALRSNGGRGAFKVGSRKRVNGKGVTWFGVVVVVLGG